MIDKDKLLKLIGSGNEADFLLALNYMVGMSKKDVMAKYGDSRDPETIFRGFKELYPNIKNYRTYRISKDCILFCGTNLFISHNSPVDVDLTI